MRQLTLPDAAAAQRTKKATKSMAMWFYANGIPFNTARSPYFRRMVAAVAAAGEGFKPPGYHALRTTLLDEVGGNVGNRGMQGCQGCQARWDAHASARMGDDSCAARNAQTKGWCTQVWQSTGQCA